MEILWKRYLTLEDVDELDNDVAEDFGIVDYESDKELKDNNYIISRLKFEGKEYTFIHGLSCRNPVGGFIDDKSVPIVAVGSLKDYDKHPLSKWYHDLTDGLTDYGDDIFEVNDF